MVRECDLPTCVVRLVLRCLTPAGLVATSGPQSNTSATQYSSECSTLYRCTVPSDTLDRVWQRLGHWPGLNSHSPPQYSVLMLSNYSEGNCCPIQVDTIYSSNEPRLAGGAGVRQLLLVRVGVSEHDLRLRPPAQLRHRLDVRLRLRQERRGLNREGSVRLIIIAGLHLGAVSRHCGQRGRLGHA